MHKRENIYKCEVCGNIVEFVHASSGVLVCCGKPMSLMEEKTTDFKTEKHIPIIIKKENSIKVTVGSTPHPMTAEHHIEWIEVIDKESVIRKYLKGDSPGAEFNINTKEGLVVREYCNLHGLWKA